MIRKIHKNNRNKTDTCLEGWGVGDTHFTGSHIGGIHISLGICVRGYTYHCDIGAKTDRGKGFSVLAAREMKRQPQNKRGWTGRGRKVSYLPSPHPPRFFTRAIFRAVFDSRSSSARKRLLCRLSEAQVECSSKTSNYGPFPSSKTSHVQNEAKCPFL